MSKKSVRKRTAPGVTRLSTYIVGKAPDPKWAGKFNPFINVSDLELRRWCIEQAIRWPVEHGVSGYAGSSMPKPAVEADVIGRATKLFNWVSGTK